MWQVFGRVRFFQAKKVERSNIGTGNFGTNVDTLHDFYGLMVKLQISSGFIKEAFGFFIGSQQADDDDGEGRKDECRQQCVDAGIFEEEQPDDDRAAAYNDTADGTGQAGFAPEQGEQHDRRESAAKTGPAVGYQTHDAVFGVEGDNQSKEGDCEY